MKPVLRVVHGLVVLAVLLLASGGGHRVSVADEIALQVLAAAGMDAADICGRAGADGGSDCPLCNLPECGGPARFDRGFVVAARVFGLRLPDLQDIPAQRRVLDLARPMRAPPVA